MTVNPFTRAGCCRVELQEPVAHERTWFVDSGCQLDEAAEGERRQLRAGRLPVAAGFRAARRIDEILVLDDVLVRDEQRPRRIDRGPRGRTAQECDLLAVPESFEVGQPRLLATDDLAAGEDGYFASLVALGLFAQCAGVETEVAAISIVRARRQLEVGQTGGAEIELDRLFEAHGGRMRGRGEADGKSRVRCGRGRTARPLAAVRRRRSRVWRRKLHIDRCDAGKRAARDACARLVGSTPDSRQQQRGCDRARLLSERDATTNVVARRCPHWRREDYICTSASQRHLTTRMQLR